MILPLQKLSMAEKLERDTVTNKNNIEETIDFYISSCNFNNYAQEIISLYRAVEGFINQDDYKSVQNPYNQQKKEDSPVAFNSVLKDYNILKGIVNLLMGEFGRRVHEYNVTQINPADEIALNDGLNLALKNYYSQAIANSLSAMQFDFGQTVQELPPLEQYVENFKAKFNDNRVISGQEILDYIKFACDLDNKYIDLYYDWVVTGGFYTYKTVNHDDVYFEVVPRHELFVPLEKHSRFIEDYSYAVRRQILPMFKIVDIFRGRISEEIIEALEKHIHSGLSTQFNITQMAGRDGVIKLPTLYNQDSTFRNNSNTFNGIELYHVVYKTFRPYYVLTYITLLGTEAVMEVGEDYKLNKANGDIKLEKHWENILYEGYKVLNFYLDCKPLEENRADLNNEGLQKLPYNGIVERSSVGEVQSIVKEGLPYQRLINVLHFQMEKLINKNKDKITVMPYGLVPRKKGISTKDMMYHADATSILWVDETAPNAAFAAQMIKTLDMSLGSYIKDTISLIQYVKQEYWDSIGMNAQRFADVGQNAGKGVTEQAITRSAIITAELTRQFDMVVEKDYRGLLDISKLAYIKGKKAKYVRSDSSVGFLNMNQDGAIYHTESSYNVFVRDANQMTDAINAMRGQAVNLIQNGGDMSVLGHLYNTNNVTKLTTILEKLDENKKAYDQATAKANQDAAANVEKVRQETAQMQIDSDKYKVDRNYDALVDSATIRVEGANNLEPKAKPANEAESMLANNKINTDAKKLELEKERINAMNNKPNNNK